MKAIVYKGVKNVEVEKVKDPIIEQEDDIVVKVTSTAICGSDLHLIYGREPALFPGFILGHETMGIVGVICNAIFLMRLLNKIQHFPLISLTNARQDRPKRVRSSPSISIVSTNSKSEKRSETEPKYSFTTSEAMRVP